MNSRMKRRISRAALVSSALHFSTNASRSFLSSLKTSCASFLEAFFPSFLPTNLPVWLKNLHMLCIYKEYIMSMHFDRSNMTEANAMNLHTAQSLLIQDRRDWVKPHLSWLPAALYRSFGSLRTKT